MQRLQIAIAGLSPARLRFSHRRDACGSSSSRPTRALKLFLEAMGMMATLRMASRR